MILRKFVNAHPLVENIKYFRIENNVHLCLKILREGIQNVLKTCLNWFFQKPVLKPVFTSFPSCRWAMLRRTGDLNCRRDASTGVNVNKLFFIVTDAPRK